MFESPRTTDSDVIRECAAKVIQSGALGRGQTFRRLLEYLVERAARGEVPKEFDIAVDVFGKSGTDLDAADAQTRVHVYKLRARLEAYYASAGKHDAFRLEIPKGTYRLGAFSNDPDVRQSTARPDPRGRAIGYAAAGLLFVSLVVNVSLWFGAPAPSEERAVLRDPLWSGMHAATRPVLVVLGDHFMFGESGSHVRIRDVAINSAEDLRKAEEYLSGAELVFETFTYLPKSTVFGLQTILPRAGASGRNVSLKLGSELTSEDLRDYDVIYVGFVRAMGILRDYYFAKSNFAPEAPLFMSLLHTASGDAYTRSGPLPQRNTDYALLARFTGPAGNQILVFSGIGDVGVLAAVRSLGTEAGVERVAAVLRSTELDAADGFELLLEADGHSRTDLDFRIIGAYALGGERASLQTTAWPAAENAPAATALNAVE